MTKRLPRQAETSVARNVVTELQRQGYETYEEVSVGYGGKRADIVAIRGPVTMVVECKVALSLKLFDQLLAWRGEGNYIIGAVDTARVGQAAQSFLQHHGFGLWLVGADEVIEKVAPRLHRTHRDRYSLRANLRPEHRSGEYARAGSQRGGYFTPFRGTCRELRTVVERQPGIELRTALAEIKHHYASSRSAMSSLPGLIRKGVIEGVRVDDGKPLRLYPDGPSLESQRYL